MMVVEINVQSYERIDWLPSAAAWVLFDIFLSVLHSRRTDTFTCTGDAPLGRTPIPGCNGVSQVMAGYAGMSCGEAL